MNLNSKEFVEGYVHGLRVLLQNFDEEVFRRVKLAGFDIPVCPVIVSATPEEWDITEQMEVGTIFAYKHDGPPIVWNNFRFQNAYFIWTSAIMQLVSRLQVKALTSATSSLERRVKSEFSTRPSLDVVNGFVAESMLKDKMTVLGMLLVRKRVICYAHCVPTFRFYTIDDLPIETQGDIFKDDFFKESISARDHERVDQLVLMRLLTAAQKTRRAQDDYSLSINLMLNHGV